MGALSIAHQRSAIASGAQRQLAISGAAAAHQRAICAQAEASNIERRHRRRGNKMAASARRRGGWPWRKMAAARIARRRAQRPAKRVSGGAAAHGVGARRLAQKRWHQRGVAAAASALCGGVKHGGIAAEALAERRNLRNIENNGIIIGGAWHGATSGMAWRHIAARRRISVGIGNGEK